MNVSDLVIPSGQGFYVEFTLANSGTVLFENALRVTNSGTIQKTLAIANSKLRISNSQSYYDSYIAFTDAATDGYNHTYDARLIPGAGTISLYSLLEEEAYVIQALAALETEKTVSLGFEAAVGFYTIEMIELLHFPEGIQVTLLDHEMGVSHDLMADSYDFIANTEGRNDTRFELQYKLASLTIEEMAETSIALSVKDHLLYVFGLEEEQINELSIFDVNGKQIINTTAIKQTNEYAKVNLDRLQSGIYFVELITDQRREVLKLPILK